MKRLNIAEILKDCPKGMELDCTMFEGLEFDGIVDNSLLPIRCRILNPDGNGYNIYNFTKYGCWNTLESAKCVIFPKGKTTWEGFQRPFKDGDVVVCTENEEIAQMFILKSQTDKTRGYCYTGYSFRFNDFFDADEWYFERLATEEEKQKLFDAIKAKGYKWNAETKTLEKLVEPKFKVGDRIKEKNSYISGIITNISDGTYKVEYKSGGVDYANIKFQDNWELVPNKFDITTLTEFESRVLARDDGDGIWQPSVWGLYDKEHRFPYITIGNRYRQCIPYEGNEHLLGTTDDCDEFYKTW